ncbi:MAG: helix-turn-helix domain-containing protein [Rhizobiales bacterium]|nr:helix-turn-helix domain-containing protein [Hyphomicrobiales bacterium]
MKAWRFTTESYPKVQRVPAWREYLSRMSLASPTLKPTDDLYGIVSCIESPLGITFARLTSGPQEIGALQNKKTDGVWVACLLEGAMTVRDGARDFDAQAGDIVYGAMGVDTRLIMRSNFRAIIVQIPRSAFNPRLLTPLPTNVIHLSGRTGVGHVLGGFLNSVSEALEDLSVDQVRPIEMALPEFLITGLFRQADTRALGGAAGVRAALLHRICQSIELQLSDPDLSLMKVADEHGISPRYVQKLFESVGQSFGRYIRFRRLERCRYDLESPVHGQLSISDICFRWGFNDAAYFSRAFREHFGVSPREYRKSPNISAEQEGPWLINRGRPTDPNASRESETSWPGDMDGASPRGMNTADGELLEAEIQKIDALAGQDEQQSFVMSEEGKTHHFLPVTQRTVHWGYFSRFLPPVLEVKSGDFVTVETLTQHAYDDYERMIKDDPGAESVFHWTKDQKNVDRRGAGPLDASTYGRGAGEGFGVHICTGPIAIEGAMPGDVVELRILDITPRPAASREYAGRTFGSNAATWWGFHYSELLTPPAPREVVTIYEVESQHGKHCAHAVYNFRWTPQTDPYGVVHPVIDYPGVPVDHSTIEKNYDVLKDIEIPLRPHFGVIGLAPDHWGIVDSVPPAYFGGNLDNWRLGAGSRIYLPVAVPGGLLSIGDPHASQGDSELCGTAIECSLTGVFEIILHKKEDLDGQVYDLDYPLIETEDEWVILGFSHPNYLKEFGKNAQTDVYKQSSIDMAMRDAFRKTRRFLMATRHLTEDEAISLMSVAIDFGITQVVDGNWGVHAVIRKSMFLK